MTAPRIISLIASSTEMVCALGCEGWLVGRSHECDFPASILQLPQCTETKFATDGTSYDIDQRVKAIAQEGLSVYRVRADAVNALQPTHILTQTQCQVCAVSERDVLDAACDIIASRPQIVTLHTDCLADLWRDMQKVADAIGVPDRGRALIAELQARMNAIAARAEKLPAPRVAYIEWIEPLMAGGNWMPELIARAGGDNVFGTVGTHSPWMTWDELRATDPDIIVIAPCGFDIARTREEMHWFTDRADWKQLRAVQNKRVALADGNQFFNRPGPRIAESLEILAEIFHPDVFKFGHQNAGWKLFGHSRNLS